MGAPNNSDIRILIVDDHKAIRKSLRMLLETHGKMTVVADAGNRSETFEAVRTHPDINIILLDLDLGDASSLDFLPQLIKEAKGARVLVFTSATEDRQHIQAAKLGARGVLLKSKDEVELFKAIEKVHAGERWFGRSLMERILDGQEKRHEVNAEGQKISSLTKRERELIATICAGATKNKQIADKLCIAEVTVRHHLTSIFEKLELSDRLELILYAYQHNLIEAAPE